MYISGYTTSNVLDLISSNQLAGLQRERFRVFPLSPKVQIAAMEYNYLNF